MHFWFSGWFFHQLPNVQSVYRCTAGMPSWIHMQRYMLWAPCTQSAVSMEKVEVIPSRSFKGNIVVQGCRKLGGKGVGGNGPSRSVKPYLNQGCRLCPPHYYLPPSDFQTFLRPYSGCVILQFCRKFPSSSFTRLPCKIKQAEPSKQEYDDTLSLKLGAFEKFPDQTGFD